MRIFRTLQISGLILSGVFFFSACTTLPPERRTVTDAELIQNLPEASRKKMLNIASKDMKRVQDAQIDQYLSSVAARVTQKRELPQHIQIQAHLIQSKKRNDTNFVWPLPPDRILFQERLLKALDFENEIAAAIAFSWELTQDLEFQERFLAEVNLAEPNLQNIYQFSEAESLKAVETSIDLLYVSRYDPRGLVSYFEKLKQLNTQGSKEVRDRLSRLQEKARRTIAYYPPLMNPTIRTQEFYRIQKRLEQL